MRFTRARRTLLYVVGGIALVLIVLRLIADPIATKLTRRALDHLDGFEGDVEHVHVDFLDLATTLTKLELRVKSQNEPALRAASIRSKARWSELFKARLAGESRMENAKAHITRGAGTGGGLNAVNTQLQRLTPIHVTRTEVVDSEVTVVTPKGAKVWLHDVEAVMENVGARDDLAKDEPSTLAMRARVQRSGTLVSYLTADANADRFNFAGRMELSHLRLADMYALLAAHTGMSIPRGSCDLLVDYRVKNDVLDGTVEATLHDVDIQAADAKAGNVVKEKIASAAYSVIADDGDLRATAPLRGTIKAEPGQVYEAVMSVAHTGLVNGLVRGVEILPSPEARK